MSDESDFQRALNEGESASYSAKQSAAKSPQSFLSFLIDVVKLAETASRIQVYVRQNWPSVQSRIRKFFRL